MGKGSICVEKVKEGSSERGSYERGGKTGKLVFIRKVLKYGWGVAGIVEGGATLGRGVIGVSSR